jgi:hypothetical protein
MIAIRRNRGSSVQGSRRRITRRSAANLYDARRQVLGEHFEEDSSRIEPVNVEPGIRRNGWLLTGFNRFTSCPAARHLSQLLTSALRYRYDVTGCVFDEGDLEGNIGKFTRPQTEIPWRGSRRPSGRAGGLTKHVRPLLAVWTLSAPSRLGRWYDQFDGDGQLG